VILFSLIWFVYTKHFFFQRRKDEFSALAEHLDIANLFQRIRSSGGSVFVIVHGDASMERQAEKLFQACSNIIVFQSNDLAHLIAHAGTRLIPDYSQHR